MSRAHITCREIMRAIFTRVGRVFGGAVLIAALGRPQCIHPRAYIATDFRPTAAVTFSVGIRFTGPSAFTNVFRLNSTTMVRIATD
jgi:hypothetical protein